MGAGAARDREGAGAPGERAFLDATLPHLDALHGIARHLGGSEVAAEDLVQETYLRAFAGFAGLRGDNVRSWLVAILLNVARSEGRRRARRPREELTPDPAGELRPRSEGAGARERWAHPGRSGLAGSERPVPSLDAEVFARLDREVIADALRKLPDEQRRAIVLMDLAGHTASEAAELLRCPRGTVLARAHRGRRRLARLLAEEGARRGLP